MIISQRPWNILKSLLCMRFFSATIYPLCVGGKIVHTGSLIVLALFLIIEDETKDEKTELKTPKTE